MIEDSTRDKNFELKIGSLEIFDNPNWSKIYKILKKKTEIEEGNEYFLQIELLIDKPF